MSTRLKVFSTVTRLSMSRASRTGRDNVAAGRLNASTSLAEAVQSADIALICVGTPSEKSGNLGLDQLRRVLAEIGRSPTRRNKPLIVAIRSTVFPGTCEEVVMPALGGLPKWSQIPNFFARAWRSRISWSHR